MWKGGDACVARRSSSPTRTDRGREEGARTGLSASIHWGSEEGARKEADPTSPDGNKKGARKGPRPSTSSTPASTMTTKEFTILMIMQRGLSRVVFALVIVTMGVGGSMGDVMWFESSGICSGYVYTKFRLWDSTDEATQ